LSRGRKIIELPLGGKYLAAGMVLGMGWLVMRLGDLTAIHQVLALATDEV